ncbi:aminotransferase class IV [Stomatohabitans albus]|uniref:aminotransferase class IV n=1 Tax=Stomatohabitans albus TaxID=3110766 RepID=UPI00300CA232
MSLPRMSKVWMDGEFVDVEAASVSVMSPTLHAGWGVYEDLSARPTNRGIAVFQHRAHQVNLGNSAKVLDIPLSYTVDELMHGVRDLCRRNSVRNAFVRILVYMAGDSLFYGRSSGPVHTAICAWDRRPFFSEEVVTNGIRLGTSSWRAIGSDSMPASAQIVGAGTTKMLALREANRSGCDEAIIVDAHNQIVSATSHSIAMVRDGELILADNADPGVIDDTLLELARHLDIPARVQAIRPDHLYTADEVFCASVTSGIVGVRGVDARNLTAWGPVTRNIAGLFQSITSGVEPRFDHMLDFVG